MSESDILPEDALAVAQHALERVNELEERVEELEASNEDTVSYDDRDGAVIERLDAGETVSITELHDLYRCHTDIRSDSTLKKRIRALVAGPDFRIARAGEILYDPSGDSDE